MVRVTHQQPNPFYCNNTSNAFLVVPIVMQDNAIKISISIFATGVIVLKLYLHIIPNGAQQQIVNIGKWQIWFQPWKWSRKMSLCIKQFIGNWQSVFFYVMIFYVGPNFKLIIAAGIVKKLISASFLDRRVTWQELKKDSHYHRKRPWCHTQSSCF